ncbi:hypothetical protein [Bradyrhizobium sp. F1.13.3]|uniref:hypothetical protein n=1 Tax=Bradyrhizobium sp. F1.13.3 TaxID=3156351 RepID=UPI003397D6D6
MPSTGTWPVRLLGGRKLGVTYDSISGTISILGQSVSLSSFAAALQAEWVTAVAATPIDGALAPFGGTNVQRAAGNLLDAAPTWRSAVQAALATYVAEIGTNDPGTWIRQ